MIKRLRRGLINFLENEDDLTQHVELIKKEFSKRNAVEDEEENDEEESIMSEKRFDEFDVSPLTVKALTSDGYVQMTKVQEATMTACLEVDEADHLLDFGFRKDMEKIVDCLPRQKQSLLFSATIPKEVRRVSQLVLKKEHAYIDTIGLGLETHAKVNQSYLVVPHEQNFQMVLHLLKEHISQVVDYKVIVFCTIAMMASLMFILLRELRLNVREMHSRKHQLYRTCISDEFKESKRLILITSDVQLVG